ncbi:MAG: hypothetical protein ATN35_10175 [Epulopiscium sp. Nele67-Bin004]|nr:MAG: hypothetical protein ATN35_10175 [Epulopiscium sp. Nele67-Bin004]
MATYNIEIQTSTERHATTFANIFIKLYGARGISIEYKLNDYILDAHHNFHHAQYPTKACIQSDEDYGDIYKIDIRSDGSGFSPNWLINYINIGHQDNGTTSKFIIPSGNWIDDPHCVYSFTVTSGFHNDIQQLEKNNIVLYSSPITIPPHLEYTHEYKKIITVSVSKSSIIVTDSSLTATANVSYHAISASFDTMIEHKLSETLSTNLNESIEVTGTYTVPAGDKERTFKECWVHEYSPYTVEMGSHSYQFIVPTDVQFGGLIEL